MTTDTVSRSRHLKAVIAAGTLVIGALLMSTGVAEARDTEEQIATDCINEVDGEYSTDVGSDGNRTCKCCYEGMTGLSHCDVFYNGEWSSNDSYRDDTPTPPGPIPPEIPGTGSDYAGAGRGTDGAATGARATRCDSHVCACAGVGTVSLHMTRSEQKEVRSMKPQAPQRIPMPLVAAVLIAGATAFGLGAAVPAGAAPKPPDQQKSECEAKGGTWVGTTDGTSFCTGPVGGTIFECDVRGNCSDDPMPRAGGTRPTLPLAPRTLG